MSRKSKANEKQSFDVGRQNDIIHRPLRSLHDNADRKCFTPSICKSSKTKTTKKSLSKQDDRRSQNRSSRQVSKPRASEASKTNFDIQDVPIPQKGRKQQKLQDSAWKYKNRPSSTLANARHAKHLQFNLQNLNESVHRHEQDSILRMKQLSFQQLDRGPLTSKKDLSLILDDGRRYLNQNKFSKAIDSFKQFIKLQGFQDAQTTYLLGICYFHTGNYQQCIDYFSNLIYKNDCNKKNLYFFLSIAYKRVGDTEAALRVLNLAIQKSPKYYDALLFRGKLLSKQRKYLEAIEDFKVCIKHQPSKVTPYTCMADCLRYMQKCEEAAELYSIALNLNQNDHTIMLKRAITFIQVSRFSEAKQDLDQIMKTDPFNSEVDSFRGLVFYKTRNFNDAILCYEQSIKNNSSKKAVTKSIYEIAKIKIQMRDFYGASYTLERADSLDVDKKVLQKIKLFTDGSTFLMKKKIKRGVQMLSQLVKKQNINEYIKPLAYSFRAYGYFCQCKYTHALNDLETLQSYGYGLDTASQFNKHLLQGIIATLNNKFEEGLQKFQVAQKMRPTTSDPSIYKCLNLVSMYNRTHQSSPSESTIIKLATHSITEAIDKEDANYNSYFLRAVINYSIGLHSEAWEDIEKAVDKSDDHVIKHFYLRALIYAGMGKYKQALGDFSNSISLMKDLREKELSSPQDEDMQPEKQIPEAYLNRAKCYLLFGQKKRAFQDLQSYISYKPLDPEIHVLAGRLLFSIGAAEDAIRAYNNCPSIEKNLPIIMERAKCYLLLKELNLCLKDMLKIVDSGDKRMMFDFICLQSLREASKNTAEHFELALKKIKSIETSLEDQGYIFSRGDFYFYKGMYYFYLTDYENALQNFMKCFSQKKEEDSLERLNTTDLESQEGFDNRIFSFEELNYNIGIVQLMIGNISDAATYLNFDAFKPLFKQNAGSNTISSDQPLDITPFPVNNRLCSIFPATSIPSHPQLEFRLSFCLPKINPPEAELHIVENQLIKLNINSTEPRPDAPWIKRNSFGVVFTQEVVGCEVDLNTQNQKSIQRDENPLDDAVRIDIGNDRSMEFDGYFKDHEPEEHNRSRLKDLLTLDPETQARLARLMKK